MRMTKALFTLYYRERERVCGFGAKRGGAVVVRPKGLGETQIPFSSLPSFLC